MKCPHCGVTFTEDWRYQEVGYDDDGRWGLRATVCDNGECSRVIAEFGRLKRLEGPFPGRSAPFTVVDGQPVRPRASARPLSPEVPDPYKSDFAKAALVLGDSPEASAGLSRRCLQALIRAKAGIRCRTLAAEIDELIESSHLPGYLSQDVDSIRHYGNFGAHLTESEATGEIIDVEPGEAEWLLDVLEGLFDFYFVQPAASAKRRARLEEKLEKAGKGGQLKGQQVEPGRGESQQPD